MSSATDLLASCAIVLLIAIASVGHAMRAVLFGRRLDPAEEERAVALPRAFQTATLEVLGPISRSLAAAGVSANGVTACSLAAGALGGVLLALGHFGLAAVAVVLASFGDALDGLIARRTGTASPGGALFDASVDRYEEFFVLGGLAFLFRSSAPLLVLVLAALLGSFMVSYGSAKAEALRVPVPKGIMRRAERAVFIGAGITAVPLAGACARAFALPAWVETSPILLALGLVAVLANLSAVSRLRRIARSARDSKGAFLPAVPGGARARVTPAPAAGTDRAVDAAE